LFFQLDFLNIFSYFFPAADTKVRPPLTDLQVSDVLDSKDDETEKVVLEKKKFLENLLSNLKTTNVSPTKKMKRSDEDVETMIEKLKINVSCWILKKLIFLKEKFHYTDVNFFSKFEGLRYPQFH
jgi:hypothetical protein